MGLNAAKRGTWHKPLVAALWPLLGAVVFAAFACAPLRFPDGAGVSLLLLMVAEIPALFIGMAHAVALTESGLRGRLMMFALGVVVVLLAAGFRLFLDVELRLLMPMLGWVIVGYLTDLFSISDDPQLASDQAMAVIEDRGTLLALLPSFLLGTVVVWLLLQAGGALIGTDFGLWISSLLDDETVAPFAWLGALYMSVASASTGYAHRAGFADDRRRLLDRDWLNALTDSGSTHSN